ncbi:aromatic-ring hydroxylase C-terminal domain-containing protein [Nocardia miyunensis]|uniref:aromatic-ring hydroxylase C-terminal domain-containing protein n=1 Tax=Nocardia miyunensis TaxID=282684 RepID=UPI00082D373E
MLSRNSGNELHRHGHECRSAYRCVEPSAHSFGDERLTAMLLRPDGVIAWAAGPGDDLDPPALREALDTWCPAELAVRGR